MSATPSAIAGFPPTPLPNTYWVAPGRILAGEYPTVQSEEESDHRLRRLLAAGVQMFFDLTEEEELPPYEDRLRTLNATVGYRRFPILDHGLPHDASLMRSILDAVDAALAANRCIYIHCRAGIGRTGTVVGCHLVRSGLGNDAALAHLTALWQQNARSSRWPTAPETPEQRRYVEQWNETAAIAPSSSGGTLQDRAAGALLGLAAGEIAGSSSSAASLLPHVAMTVCLADSLLARGKSDARDQMQRYLRWVRPGQQGKVRPDIPIELQRAVAAFQFSRKVYAGSHDPTNRDAHSLPRTAAVALFYHNAVDDALKAAIEASRTTQQSPVVLDACRFFAALLIDALSGQDKKDWLAGRGAAVRTLRRHKLKPEVLALMDGQWRAPARTPPRSEPKAQSKSELMGQPRTDSSPPNVLQVLSAAVRAVDSTTKFADAVQSAVRLGDGSGTLGAVCGALAGAHYGAAGIPAYFRQTYHRKAGSETGEADLEGDPDLEDLAKSLCIE